MTGTQEWLLERLLKRVSEKYGPKTISQLMYHPDEDAELLPERPILYKVKGYEDRPHLVGFFSDTTQERADEVPLFTRREVQEMVSTAWDLRASQKWLCYDEEEGFWGYAMDAILYGKPTENEE